MTKILFIVGSIRKGSFNRQLSDIAEKIVSEWAVVDRLDISAFPFMNQDFEFPAPEAVSDARKKIGSADAVWIFTPEYNHSIPGVLKNALDWLSRPLDPADPQRVSAVTGKKVIMTGAGGGKKTAFCRAALKDLLTFIGMEVLDGEGRGFALDRRTFTENIWEPDGQCISDLEEQSEILRTSLDSE